jgi:opacity protein-like surface antigen
LLSAQPLLFEIKDFNGVHVGGEYLIGFGRIEAGVGLGYTQRTVPTIYAHLTHSDGSEIEQDLKLRTIPVTFTARFLPLGRGAVVEPYIGAGIAAIRWKYSEVGEFVDAADNSIFPARFTADGTAVGPTVVAGLRAPVSNWTIGGDLRWQKAEAKGLFDKGFLGDKLDLGGWTTNFTVGVRF